MSTAAIPKRRLRSVSTAAEEYDVNPRTVRRWITDGLITGYRLRGLVKVDLDEIERKIVKVMPAAAPADGASS
jgi:excisionase family DNA binding protein